MGWDDEARLKEDVRSLPEDISNALSGDKIDKCMKKSMKNDMEKIRM